MTKPREAWNKFINASFVKFCRENYPELEVSKITEFGFTRGFEEGLKSESERSKFLIEALEYLYDACHDREQKAIDAALAKYKGDL